MRIPFISNWIEKRFKLNEAVTVLANQNLSSLSNAGVTVTLDKAMTYAAVFACVRILAESVASLPFIVYERTPDGKRRAYDHPLFRLLHDEPNPEMSAVEFKECLQGSAVLGGNAYAKIEWKNGWPVALWPLIPARMDLNRVGRALVYRYVPETGGTVNYAPSDILHVKGPSPDGLVGWSPLKLARESIGLGLAAEEYGARLFSNDARPGGVLEHPDNMSKEAYDRLRDSWNEMHRGAGNSHKAAILEEGTTWKTIGIAPEDAQFLETRRFQVVEIARIFRIPPHMLADLERATFSNIEQQSIEFVIHTLRPWLVRWEQAVHRVLFTAAERGKFFAEHLVDGLLRGDIKSRYDAYAVGRQNGWLSANDIRGLENMNPVDGGDTYLVPLNMIPADQVSMRPTPKESNARHQLPAKEIRSQRSITERNRLAQAHTRLFRAAAARIVRREGVAIKRAVKKYLSQRDAGSFRTWLDEFYQDLPDFIGTAMMPVMMTYGEAVGTAAADEVGGQTGMTPPLESFVRNYGDVYIKRHIGSSVGQIRKLLAEAEADDVAAAITTRADEWADTRPDKIAERETVQLMGAVSRFVYGAAGITAIRWNAQGSDSCPYCQELDGTIVGIEQAFKHDGDEYKPDGAEGSMKINGTKLHPPLHEGCVCSISAA